MKTIVICSAAALAAAAPLPAAAQEADDSPFAHTATVSAERLGAITGQADLAQVIRARNTSNVSNNSVSGNSVTGTISFDNGAFQNLNGLSVLSANTGNNVAINSSLNVNVTVTP